MKLKDKDCKMYTEGTPPMEKEKLDILSQQISNNWKILEGKSLLREFEFNNFIDGIHFVDDLARAAEEKNHHPDIDIRYNKITTKLSTHTVGGLTENDFIMAAKIDELINSTNKN